jgi:hypothetical protein
MIQGLIRALCVEADVGLASVPGMHDEVGSVDGKLSYTSCHLGGIQRLLILAMT